MLDLAFVAQRKRISICFFFPIELIFFFYPIYRKISAHEFEKGGLLKPIVNTIDGTPTFLSISPQHEPSSCSSQHANGIQISSTGRPQRLSRSELKQLDEKELIFELVSR